MLVNRFFAGRCANTTLSQFIRSVTPTAALFYETRTIFEINGRHVWHDKFTSRFTMFNVTSYLISLEITLFLNARSFFFLSLITELQKNDILLNIITIYRSIDI